MTGPLIVSLERQAHRWSSSTGFLILGDFPGGAVYSHGNGVSDDGTVVVGLGTSDAGTLAFRWTETTGLTNLGDLPGGVIESGALRVLRDGTLIVGFGTSSVGQEAVLWDETLTMYRLADLLNVAGATVPSGWTLNEASDIVRNGLTVSICGTGTNPQGNREAWIARYNLPCDAVDVVQSPEVATASFGGSAQLTVVATGTGPLSYQWRKNNVNLTDGPVGCGGTISGATTDTLVLNTVTFVEGGSYDCVVTNACGSDTSATATLTINPPPAAADVNHDGQVNGADIQALVNALLAP